MGELMSTSSIEPDDINDDQQVDGEVGDQASATDDATDSGDATLGDAGKKALDAMKAKWRAERDARKDAEDKLAAASKPKAPEGEPVDVEELRKQIRDEARSESLRESALDKLEAKAARLFQNPEDARAFLASKVDDFIDGGKVDVEAIADALNDLLTSRPYLGVTQGDAKRFKGTGDGGPRNAGSSQLPQLSKSDLERMSREGKFDEITEAKKAGRFNDLLGIKP